MKRKLDDFGTRSAAENKILAKLDSGEFIVIHNGLPPETGGEYDVRATFIRYLALGGCKAYRLHEKGLMVLGARITGVLDLEGCELPRDLGLIECRFEDQVIFRRATLQNLFLNGSTLPEGLRADGLAAKGDAFLPRVEAQGAVRLLGAKLGGDLACTGAKFNAAKDKDGGQVGDAFTADGLEAKGGASLQGVEAQGVVRLLGAKLGGDLVCAGAKFHAAKDKDGGQVGFAFSADRLEAKGGAFLQGVEAHGVVRLLGAKLGGNLYCTRAKFHAAKDRDGGQVGFAFSADMLKAKGGAILEGMEAQGEVRLLGAKLGGDLVCAGAKFNVAKDKDGGQVGDAFAAEGLEAEGTFFLRSGAKVNGRISLSSASVGALNDEAGCWPEGEGQIGLNRFRYGAILGPGPVDAKTRTAWLKKLDHDGGFSPQPYEQLAKVLREMGHREDARVVMIKKEELQRVERRKKRREGLLFEDAYWFSIWDRVMAWTVRYGYRPFGAVGWLAGILLVGMMIFGVAEGNGAFKPNDSRVWLSQTWSETCKGDVVCFMKEDKGKSYPEFNPFIYSADVLLPIVDLDMQDAWIPDEDKAPWVRAYMWLHIALGWFFSLLAVAGFSGLIKPE